MSFFGGADVGNGTNADYKKIKHGDKIEIINNTTSNKGLMLSVEGIFSITYHTRTLVSSATTYRATK